MSQLIEARPVQVPAAEHASFGPATDDSPRREIRAGLVVAGAFFLLFLGWAALARLDAAAYGAGQVTVSGYRQAVQHRDGGIVGTILVKEGQRVEQGQVLMRLAAAEVLAEERALSGQAIGMLAQRARLRAEQSGLSVIPEPAEFASLSAADRLDADRAMQIQRTQLNARSSLLGARRGVLSQQRAQVGEQIQGYQRQLDATREQERLIIEELESLRTVADQGFVSKNRVRALERARAELKGRAGQLEAAISQAGESVGESRIRTVEAETSRLDNVAAELRDVELALNELLPKWRAARERLAKTEVRSPATGRVVGLNVFTAGAVISPGQRILDVVPERLPLVIEARFAPEEIDDLTVGQTAIIRFRGLPSSTVPDLEAELTRVSADSLADDRSGETFIVAELAVSPEHIHRFAQAVGNGFTLKPGMPADVMVPLRKRTALQYLLEPLTDTMWRSFHEQ